MCESRGKGEGELTGGDGFDRDGLGAVEVRFGDVLLGVEGGVEERVDEG